MYYCGSTLSVSEGEYTSRNTARHLLTHCHSIYVACIVNSLITPSINRRLHVTVGRIGFVLGAWGFGWGAWMSWGRKPVDLDFAIPITIGGVLQIISQALGYWAIQQYRAVGIKIAEASSPEREAQLKGEQQSHLMLHIGCMIGLFVNACTIPAIIRVTDGGGVPLLLAAIGGLNILSHFYSNHFFTRMRNAVITSRADEMTPLVN